MCNIEIFLYKLNMVKSLLCSHLVISFYSVLVVYQRITLTTSFLAKDTRLQDQRQNSAAGNKENIKPSETSPSFPKPESKGWYKKLP